MRNTESLRIDDTPNIKRPPIRWLGGKWRIAPWIVATFPAHTCYVEPFGGGANVLLQKPISRLEVYNDLDGEVVNFFKVLRKNPRELVDQIELTPFARDELNQACTFSNDPLERARRFYVKCWQSFQPGSGYDRSPSWRFQKNWARGKSTIDEWNTTDHLFAVAKRLKYVQFENRPAEEVLQRFDGFSTLFYLDPPYLGSTRSLASETRYKHEMNTDAEHAHLAALVHQLSGMVIVSGYASALYNELYQDWHCIQKSTTTNGNSVSTEYLWLSPSVTAIEHLPLFNVR